MPLSEVNDAQSQGRFNAESAKPAFRRMSIWRAMFGHTQKKSLSYAPTVGVDTVDSIL